VRDVLRRTRRGRCRVCVSGFRLLGIMSGAFFLVCVLCVVCV